MRFLTILILGVALIKGNLQLQAQQLGLKYNTEWQTNFKGDYNWVNLLRLDGSMNVSQCVSLHAATISVAKTSPTPIIPDLQGYSNIEERSIPLAIAVLGVGYSFRESTLFLGIRNVNEDYFTTPITSLFVNSSCGIFPTISGSYDLANYPLASWGAHYAGHWRNLTLHASLYEGLGHTNIAGHDNVFEFNPRRDGMFAKASATYSDNGSDYSAGVAVSCGLPDEDANRTWGCVPWVNIEQRITDTCSAIAQASFSTTYTQCRSYFGLGAALTIGKAQFGVIADYARFEEQNEIATELTCRIELSDLLTLQPAFEVVRTGSSTNTVGLLRLTLSL